jgi:hypothetical protein
MSYAKRTRGLRIITVQDVEFRWRFLPEENNSVLVIYGSTSGCQPLRVTLRGWRDAWLSVPSANTNEPSVIKPKFVSQAVIYGLANGWLPSQAGPSLCVSFKDGEFQVVNAP